MFRHFAIEEWIMRISCQQFVTFIVALTSISTLIADEKIAPPSSNLTAIDFANDIRPILASKCHDCHGAKTQKAELDLSTPEGIQRGGESGSLWSDEPTDGLLYEYIREKTMPPEDAPPLTDSEIATISQWIESGAPIPNARVTEPSVNQHDVLSILRLRCTVCHGRQKRENNLDLRTVASILEGGKSGPAISLGKPEDSLILKRIHHGEMPPKRQLAAYSIKPMPQPEIEILSTWIKAGAPVVQLQPDVASEEPDKLVSDEDRAFWAFQPPKKPTLPLLEKDEEIKNRIDLFIARQLHARDLTFNPRANQRTLARRLYFDLIGLPPTPDELDSLSQDSTEDGYEKLVDRLLASPYYGERWGQFWIDLAGYSDSEGIQHADRIRKHAYRYRDYVIRAFNRDKPYNRFLMEQLAGDELAEFDATKPVNEEIYDNLVATGFLRLAADGTDAGITNFVPDRLEIIDDELEILSSSIMGLTLRCARCHSHKFDPIPQRDYYRLAAVFKGAWDEHDWLTPGRKDDAAGKLDRYLPVALNDEFQHWKKNGSKRDDQPLVRALWDRGEPTPTYILRRGNYLTRGRLVGAGVPSVLTDGKTPFEIVPPWPGANSTGRRLAFAKWITKNDHPLTARVLVNRIWFHHFGRGLVTTLDNFGIAGTKPTHPQLLDWLATEFIESGWSIKRLHRLIVTSRTYQQSSHVRERHLNLDPDNRWLSRMLMQRLEGEVLRDSMLAVANSLDQRQFGPADGVTARGDGLVTSTPRIANGKKVWRRSIYVLKRRTQPVTFLENFDVPRMNPNCVQRSESIVAPQALHLTNNSMVYELAGEFARRVQKEIGSDTDKKIDHAIQLAFGRPPRPEESTIARKALKSLTEKWLSENRGTRIVCDATDHLWIRESEPDRVFEDDLISVWSSKSSDGARRVGLLEFDVSTINEFDLLNAHIEIGPLNDTNIKQSAALIPPGIADYNWTRFEKDKLDAQVPFDSFGAYDSSNQTEVAGEYVRLNSATSRDLDLIARQSRESGRLAIALTAIEDGNAYRRDWDDGRHRTTKNKPPRLVIYDKRPDPNSAADRAFHDFCHALFNSASFLYID